VLGSTQELDCYSTPNNASCARFSMAPARLESNIALICVGTPSMRNMTGCSVSRICPQMPSDIGGVYCKLFSVYLDICTDMPMMKGCGDYTSLCSNVSVVAECNTPKLQLPSGAQLKNKVSSICNTMWMDGCEQCIQKNVTVPCDSFLVYSNLCVAMPDMPECSLWSSYCASVPEWTICGGDPSNPNSAVEMKMYWHTTINDYVLFKSWVPRTSWSYILTLVACFFFAVLYEGLKAFIAWLENKWRRDSLSINKSESDTFLGDNVKLEIPAFDPTKDSIRSLLHMFSYGLHYWVMLLAMTYNVGIFLAILVGHAVGYLCFGRFSRLVRAEADCCN